MSTEQNKDLVRRFYEEVWSKGNIAQTGEFIAADFVDHNPPGPGFAPGLEGAKQVFTMFHAAFSNMNVTIPRGRSVDDVIAEGDKVVSRYTGTGAHTSSRWTA